MKEISQKKQQRDLILDKFKDLEISPDILALRGIIKGKYPDDFDYREARYNHLNKKHDL
jgi:hypothetical protein